MALGVLLPFERPPEVIDRLSGALPSVGPGDDEEAGSIIQGGVDVDLAAHPGDAEPIDVHLPERVNVASLESLERLGFLDDAEGEPVPLQNAMDCAPADLNTPPGEDRVDS